MTKLTHVIVMLLFILCYVQNKNAQETIKASIVVDAKGKMLIKEQIQHYTSLDTLLLYKNSILGESDKAALIQEPAFKKFTQCKNTNGTINFSVNPPIFRDDNFFADGSAFFVSENYLALNKSTYHSKKQIALNLSLPTWGTLIYPTEKDLQKKFYKAPAIIAGDFEENVYEGYTVFTQTTIESKEEQIKKIIGIINNVLTHFQGMFSEKENKPEIVFLPFKKGLMGKQIDNLIVLNESLINDEWFNEDVLIHETINLWWGQNTMQFENPALAVGIAEFFTLTYLKKTKAENYFERMISYKRRSISSIKTMSYNNIEDENTYRTFCYDVLPVLMWSKNKGGFVTDVLVEFYRNNQNSFISLSEGEDLFNLMGVQVGNKI